MRVALLNSFDINGGAARAMQRLRQGLDRIGIDNTLYVSRAWGTDPTMVEVKPNTPDELADWRRREAQVRGEEAPYEVLRGWGPFHSERAARAQLLEQRLGPVDLINLHWTRGLVDWSSFMAARRPGQALVWTLHDQHPFTGGCHYAGDCVGFTMGCGRCPVLGSDRPDDLSAQVMARKAQALSTLRVPLHFVTPSRWMATELRRSRLFADRPVHVVPPGLDTGLFRPVDTGLLRQKLGIAPDDRVVLFIAHALNDPRKGYALLQAGLMALPDPAGIVLVTVGQGDVPAPPGIRTLAMGPLDADADLVPLYALADLVAVPSLQDNYPNAALEAMACGTGIVGLPIGGLSEITGDGERGRLADGTDAAAFARALADAVGDRARLAAWGHAGRAFVEQECTLERHAGRYAALYAAALAEARSGAASIPATAARRQANEARRTAIHTLTPRYGGLSDGSFGIWDFLLAEQQRRGISGHGLEIGVFRGSGLAAMAPYLRPDERVLAIDIAPQRDLVAGHLAGFGLDSARIDWLEGCSRQLRRTDAAASWRGTCRFLHIDGEHSYDAVRNDLDWCTDLMAPGAVISVDDVLRADSLCVTHALFDHLRDHPHRLCLFLCGLGKAYLCAPADLGLYRQACLDGLLPWLEADHGLKMRLAKNSHAWEQGYLGITERGDDPPYMEIGLYRHTPPR